jgi:hypothetical protein
MAPAGLDRLPYRVWVLCGDSEIGEGSMWEAWEGLQHRSSDVSESLPGAVWPARPSSGDGRVPAFLVSLEQFADDDLDRPGDRDGDQGSQDAGDLRPEQDRHEDGER